MALQKAVALNEYYLANDNLKIYDGGGGGGSSTKTTSTVSKTSSSNYQITNISSSHPLYPGIIGSNTQCSLFPTNTKVYIIDGNKLSGEGATYFNNGKVWHTHYFNNTTYELTYHNNTYWYKIKGAIANVSNTNNKETTNKSALESLLKITEVLKDTLTVKENSDTVDETIKEETTPIVSTTTTYNQTKTILPKNKTTIIEVLKNNIETIQSEETLPKINLNDLVSKGKLTFETKVNVSYSYTYNLVNIIPNPLYNELINDKYNDSLYATGDLNGENNTSYLQLNKQNIVNNISKNYYLPSIGELGISMENIQIINDSIDSLGEEYASCKIPDDAIIASSSLYSNTSIINDNYHVTNNLNNVWCFNNKEAEITYKPISNKFTIIPFYKFKNNMVINLDEEIEDVVINSIMTIESAIVGTKYYELNSPIHNIKIPSISEKNVFTDFNTSNWFEHPFNSKYFFNILFPEVQDYITLGDNFTNLHNDYLTYYIYKTKDNRIITSNDFQNNYLQEHETDINNIHISYDENSFLVEKKTSSTSPKYYYYDIENNSRCKEEIHSNNGILLPTYLIENTIYKCYINDTDDTEPHDLNKIYSIGSYFVGKKYITYAYYPSNTGENTHTTYSSYYIGTKTSDFWKQYLIYNVIIYNNHMVLMPIMGSGENNYNFKKNKTEVLLYIAIPTSCDNFNCKMNNTTDCNISFYLYETINEFNIYCIELNFNENIPTDNVLIFSCKYQNQTFTKKYFYSIYSLTWAGDIDNKNTTYFSIDNYYVAKDPYGWWNINKWNKLNKDWTKSNTVNYSYYIKNGTSQSYATSYSYIYNDSFGKLFDSSYTKTNVRFNGDYLSNGHQENSTITLNSYTQTTYNQQKYYNTFKNLSYSYFDIMYDMSYLINYIGKNIGFDDHGTVLERGLRVDRIIDTDINNQIKTISYLNLFDCYFLENKLEMNHDYHLFTINSYFNNSYNNIMDRSDRQYFKPIIRINRTMDNFGIYDDLIFLDVESDVKNSYHIKCDDSTWFLGKNGNIEENKAISVNNNVFEYDYDDMTNPKSTVVWYNSCTGHFGGEDQSLEVIENKTIYTNKFSLNIPIVGAKQSICLGLDMIEYIKSNIFENDSDSNEDNNLNENNDIFYYYNYIFSDYLFLYNNTNGVISLLISDPSLSMVNKKHAIIQLKPNELKLYYPSNFNYNNTSNHDILEEEKIYSIKLINKTSNIKNIIFNHYKFGELNNSFEEMINGETTKKLKDETGFLLVTNLMKYYNDYINGQNIGSNSILNAYNIKKPQDKDVLEKNTNEININIKNYNKNKAGHLIIIDSDKIIKKNDFYINLAKQYNISHDISVQIDNETMEQLHSDTNSQNHNYGAIDDSGISHSIS